MLLFGKYILIVIVAVLMLCVLSYISVPVYDFQSGRSFCGDHLQRQQQRSTTHS